MRLSLWIASIVGLAFTAPAVGQSGHSMPGMATSPQSGHSMPGMATPPQSEHSMPGMATPATSQASAGGHEAAPIYFFFRANRLDYGASQLGARGSWDIDARVGTDEHRLVLKSEGDYIRGKGQLADLQLLYSTPINEFFDFQVGARQLFAPAARSYFAIGVQGLAPGFIVTEATLFVSEKGQVSARVKAELDLAWTGRIYSRPSIELEAHASDDRRVGTSAGMGTIKLALQTRYQITRAVAPYIEIGWEKEFGTAARIAQQGGERSDNAYAVLGIRLLY